MHSPSLICILALFPLAQSKLVQKFSKYIDVGNCAIGQGEFCPGTFKCVDGTTVGKPGSCANCFFPTSDPSPFPRCGSNQVWQDGRGDPTYVPSGRGFCADSPFGNDWVRLNYTFGCKDCPTRFVGIFQGRSDVLLPRGPDDSNNGDCVACSEPNEILVGDAYYGFRCETQRPKTGRCKMNLEGIDMVRKHEHLCTYFYNDRRGHKAIGYGHDCCANNDCSDLGLPNDDTIDYTDALRILYQDLAKHEPYIAKLVGAASMTDNQFSSFVDYSLGYGPSAFTTNYANEIKAQDWGAICKKFATLSPNSAGNATARAALCRKPTTLTSGCRSRKLGERTPVLSGSSTSDLYANWTVDVDALASNCPSRLHDPHPNPQPLCKPWTAGKNNCVGSGCVKPACQHKVDTS